MFFIKKKNSIRAINSNINNAKTEIITKFTIVDFSSYIPNGSLYIGTGTDTTLTIPGISNYQYIKCVGASDQLFGGFAKIKSDGSFYSTRLDCYQDDNRKFCVQRIHGVVSGNTLTFKKGGSGIGVFGTDGLGKPANYLAGDNYTITSILCLGKK